MMTALLIPLLVLAGRAPTPSYPVTMHTVVDGFAIHGVAYHYLAPKGWKTLGGVVWQGQIASVTALTAVAVSPDERFAYLIAQGQDFPYFVKNGGMWVNVMTQRFQQGVTPPERFSDFLLDYAKRILKVDLTVTKREDHRLTGTQLPPARNLGAVGAVEFDFTDNKGRACTGAIAAMMHGFQAGDTVNPGMSYQGEWCVQNLFLIGAPKGEEKKAMRFFSIGAPTFTPTRSFLKARGAYQMVLNHQIDIQIANAGEVSKATSRMSRQMEDAIMGRYHSEQKGNDKAQSAFCDMIGDVARSRALDGTEIQSNSNAGPVWEDGHGNLSMGGDPNAGSGGGWTKLKKAGE